MQRASSAPTQCACHGSRPGRTVQLPPEGAGTGATAGVGAGVDGLGVRFGGVGAGVGAGFGGVTGPLPQPGLPAPTPAQHVSMLAYEPQPPWRHFQDAAESEAAIDEHRIAPSDQP